MAFANVTLQLPESLYERLVNTARATHQPVDQVIVRAVEMGSPPAWDDVPPEFQPDFLAALDRLGNDAVEMASSRMPDTESAVYDDLLERNERSTSSPSERAALYRLRADADRFMLRKAHAAVLLSWRGAPVPAP